MRTEIFLLSCIGSNGLLGLGLDVLPRVNWEISSSPSSLPPKETICGSLLFPGVMLLNKLRRGTSFSLIGSLKGGGFLPNSLIVLYNWLFTVASDPIKGTCALIFCVDCRLSSSRFDASFSNSFYFCSINSFFIICWCCLKVIGAFWAPCISNSRNFFFSARYEISWMGPSGFR